MAAGRPDPNVDRGEAVIVLLVLLRIVAALLALVALLLALALASRVHVEASLAADGCAEVPVAGWAHVRWLQLRGRLELPALELRLSFLGIPLRRIHLRGRDAAESPAETQGTKEVEKKEEEDDGEKRSRFRLRRPAIGRLRLALRTLRRSLRLERLDGELVVATPDPALTGELLAWGYALGAVLPRPPRGRFALASDFTAELPRGRLAFDASLGVGGLALAGWRFARAFGLVRTPFGRRRKG